MGNESESVYSRIGGSDAVRGVVDTFYKRMLSDDRVKSYFENTDMAKQKAHMGAFITMATGGPNAYEGRDMKVAHEGMKIDNMAFDATVENLVTTLTEAGVAEADIATLGEALAPMRGDIVEKD